MHPQAETKAALARRWPPFASATSPATAAGHPRATSSRIFSRTPICYGDPNGLVLSNAAPTRDAFYASYHSRHCPSAACTMPASPSPSPPPPPPPPLPVLPPPPAPKLSPPPSPIVRASPPPSPVPSPPSPVPSPPSPMTSSPIPMSPTASSSPAAASPQASAQAGPPGGGAPSGFIRVQGGTFVDDDCNEFLLFGWNSWRLVEASQGIQNALPKDTSVLGGLNEATYLAQQAKAHNFNVMRLFGIADVNYNEGMPLQPSPGQYNEQVFKAIDFILNEMGKQGIKVIVALVDYWKKTDGVQQYADWCAGGNKDSFFTDSHCQQLYMNHIKTFVNRRNTYSGKLYKEDANILAWDLLNEPRYTSGGTSAVQNWVDMFAPFIKSQDPNHMVTIGEEGFFGPGDPHVSCNPGYPNANWPAYSGQDFTNNHRNKAIDFTAVHAWPDNWQVSGADFMTNWVNCHIAASASLGKPMVLEEFGKVVSSDNSYARTSERNPYFTAAYDAVDGSLSSGGQCKGSLFWEWTVRNPSESIDVSLPNGLHPYGVSVWDETFTGPIQKEASYAQSLQGKRNVPGCALQGQPVTAFG
ncbi:hypothetical protein CVIRNUC_009823 [Coccomyxa viridis]|uniref:mannan endo-1,4-beta-mannosidase n=1 Tax=Coccomyxa viridis TaxID=1274662 RepID=A0AAV1IHN9_9CHLO|nr:hypothetical protein CVIRNUC_009823 [Coccomyxa viridis]